LGGEPSSHQTKLHLVADADTMELIRSIRTRRGLAGAEPIESLLMRMTRTREDAPPEYETRRLLLPASFQQVTRWRFTVVGDTFWQHPEPRGDLALAERNTRFRFAETVLVFLMAGTESMPLTVRRVSSDSKVLLDFTGPGGCHRRLAIDTAADLEWFEEETEFSQGSRSTTVQRRLSVNAFQQFGGVTFPTIMKESIGGWLSDVSVQEIVVNRDVSVEDFRKPR
jgi:hypothetical protein